MVTQIGLQMGLGTDPFDFRVYLAQKERQRLSWEGLKSTWEISEKLEAEKQSRHRVHRARLQESGHEKLAV